jgi:hypothetical protein
VTAVAFPDRLFWLHFALGAALSAAGCQHDSTASFDDSQLGDTDAAGASSSQGGAEAEAGESSGGSAAGGVTPAAGKNSGGNAGSVSGGGMGGVSGAPLGGQAGTGGKGGGGAGGKAGADMGGSGGKGGTGGSANPPEPITFETRDIDDTSIASCHLNQNFGAEPSLTVDASGSGQGVCTYRGLFTAPLATIPKAAEITAATLTLTCLNAGDAVTVSYVEQLWAELSVAWSTRPELGSKLGTVTCEMPGKLNLDLTSAARAWLAGEHQNYGIYLTTEGDDGTDFATSEAKSEAERPLLSVTYKPPAK